MKKNRMERIYSNLAALAMIAISIGVFTAGDTVSHKAIDRSTTSAGGSSVPESLSATQEVTPNQLLPTAIDDSLTITAFARDTVKIVIQVTPKDPALPDSVWVTVVTDSANALAAESWVLPNTYRSWYAYRIKLDDVEGAATWIKLWEEFQYTRGGRGW